MGINLEFPEYEQIHSAIHVLALPFAPSELHGMFCAFLCAGQALQAESYLRALMPKMKEEGKRHAVLQLFDLFSYSQQQFNDMDFAIRLLLPEDQNLTEQARAFSEWCHGFLQGLSSSGFKAEQLHDEENQEALEHMAEFAELDYENIRVEDADERAFMELYEYSRLAVLKIHAEMLEQGAKPDRARH